MKKSYGIPYVGSKNKIAEWILSYLPEDRFVCIAQKEKDNLLSSLGGGRKKVEKLFIPKANLEDYKKQTGELF